MPRKLLWAMLCRWHTTVRNALKVSRSSSVVGFVEMSFSPSLLSSRIRAICCATPTKSRTVATATATATTRDVDAAQRFPATTTTIDGRKEHQRKQLQVAGWDCATACATLRQIVIAARSTADERQLPPRSSRPPSPRNNHAQVSWKGRLSAPWGPASSES